MDGGWRATLFLAPSLLLRAVLFWSLVQDLLDALVLFCAAPAAAALCPCDPASAVPMRLCVQDGGLAVWLRGFVFHVFAMLVLGR